MDLKNEYDKDKAINKSDVLIKNDLKEIISAISTSKNRLMEYMRQTCN